MAPIRFLCALMVLLSVAAPARAAAGAPPDVILLRSEATAAFLKANGGNYDLLVGPWRALFKRHGIDAREMTARELGQVRRDAILVLPSAVALGDPERRAIRAKLAAGWSALGTWAVGARDGKGEWKGYDFISEVFGARIVHEYIPDKEESFLLPYGETPLTSRLPAGKRLYLAPGEPFLRMEARHGAARFGNYMREVTAPGALLSAAAFDARGRSRRAYFGFAESAWSSAQADVDALILGTLEWLAHRPFAAKAAWPMPHQSALLVEMDTEDKFSNGLLFAQELERHGLRGTFFCLTSEAVKYPDVVSKLAAAHELAYHADVHTGFSKVAPAQQEQRLRNMIAQLAKVMPTPSTPASGFRPPLEEYDAATLKLLGSLKLSYMAGSPDSTPDSLPMLADGGALVVFPRTWTDDITLLRAGELQAKATQRILMDSLRDTMATRGLGLLSLHSQHFYPGSPVQLGLPRLLEAATAKGSGVWLPAGQALSAWWRAREAVRLTAEQDLQGLKLRVENAGQPLRSLGVLIFPGGRSPQLVEATAPAKLVRLDPFRWALVPEMLPAGESRFRIRL